jgi:hypothetical protein
VAKKKKDTKTGHLFVEEIPAPKPAPYVAPPQKQARVILPFRGSAETTALKIRARFGQWPDWYLTMLGGEERIPQHVLAAVPFAIDAAKNYRVRDNEWYDGETAWMRKRAEELRFMVEGTIVWPAWLAKQVKAEYAAANPEPMTWNPWPPVGGSVRPPAPLSPSTEGRAIARRAS